ncbi:hypothetical protein FM037_16640 [Shewanella psychropiezotolerans]|uniref:Uncharacterized protein n=1 Tax=Shewanella psychropiezotolerans TaxID=2593655 RepID=A0ABX5WZK3_9GAMM|nr:hypothetical protein [Shewanella psychropiezotolerans]QDO84536.1 hypothetical protein FM037_16640 [Shewanella psychropiezotolerans]
MQLENFVSQTLKQIIDGVSSAQKYSETKNAKINPSTARMDGKATDYSFCVETYVPLQGVEFDVAVTVKEASSTSEGGGDMGEISVTSASQASNQNSSVSRIKFKVPILLPLSK